MLIILNVLFSWAAKINAMFQHKGQHGCIYGRDFYVFILAPICDVTACDDVKKRTIGENSFESRPAVVGLL